jgi:hypothetical protein
LKIFLFNKYERKEECRKIHTKSNSSFKIRKVSSWARHVARRQVSSVATWDWLSGPTDDKERRAIEAFETGDMKRSYISEHHSRTQVSAHAQSKV